MAVILASGSPRRKELLTMLGVRQFEVCPAKGEEHPPLNASPEEIVMALAASKAREVAAARDGAPEDVIIAADTIVWQDGKMLGKPRSAAEAEEMLLSLQGRTHEVYTGVAVIALGRENISFERTAVSFRPAEVAEIRAYIATGEPMDKAGAYGAQGIGSKFVSRIDGDFFNVMGMPVCRLYTMLKDSGVVLF